LVVDHSFIIPFFEAELKSGMNQFSWKLTAVLSKVQARDSHLVLIPLERAIKLPESREG